MAELRMGTCSWKYDSWRGLIYSHEKKINHLEEYSRHYNTVEIDQWFWSLFGVDKVSLPSPFTVTEYVRSVPLDFKFTVKIPNSITLTHFYRKSKNDPLVKNPYFLSAKLFEDFLFILEPMKDYLGALMFQFEYLNKQKMPGQQAFQDKFSDFLKRIPSDYIYAIESRNPNYLNDKFFGYLNENRLIPVFLQGYYMPPVTEVYNKFRDHLRNTVIIRLHGSSRSDIEKRSKGDWSKIYDPRDRELDEIGRMIGELMDRNINIYVNMNNHYEGSAPLSIRRLEKILQSVE